MRIENARLLPYRLGFRTGLGPGPIAARKREGYILELLAENGNRGYGEAAPAWWLGEEDLDVCGRSLRAMVDAIRRDPLEVTVAFETKKATIDVAGLTRAGVVGAGLSDAAQTMPAAARCALHTAILDLGAKLRGSSLAVALGCPQTVTLDTSALVSGDEVEELVLNATRALELGYRCLKLKVGHLEPRLDVQRVIALRRAVGPLIALRLDANRSWDFDTASEVLAAMAAIDPEFVEEPLKEPRPRQLALLRELSGVRLALDESIVGERDLSGLATAAGSDVVVVIKLARVGGPLAALALASTAEGLGHQVVFTDSIESSVGMSATLHCAAAAGCQAAIGLGGSALLQDDVVSRGRLSRSPSQVPRGPGLGVVLRDNWTEKAGRVSPHCS